MDPMIRNAVPLPKSMWDGIKQYQQMEGIRSTAEAVRRVVLAGLRALDMIEQRHSPPPKSVGRNPLANGVETSK